VQNTYACHAVPTYQRLPLDIKKAINLYLCRPNLHRQFTPTISHYLLQENQFLSMWLAFETMNRYMLDSVEFYLPLLDAILFIFVLIIAADMDVHFAGKSTTPRMQRSEEVSSDDLCQTDVREQIKNILLPLLVQEVPDKRSASRKLRERAKGFDVPDYAIHSHETNTAVGIGEAISVADRYAALERQKLNRLERQFDEAHSADVEHVSDCIHASAKTFQYILQSLKQIESSEDKSAGISSTSRKSGQENDDIENSLTQLVKTRSDIVELCSHLEATTVAIDDSIDTTQHFSKQAAEFQTVRIEPLKTKLRDIESSLEKAQGKAALRIDTSKTALCSAEARLRTARTLAEAKEREIDENDRQQKKNRSTMDAQEKEIEKKQGRTKKEAKKAVAGLGVSHSNQTSALSRPLVLYND
jgi:hypothetical protein